MGAVAEIAVNTAPPLAMGKLSRKERKRLLKQQPVVEPEVAEAETKDYVGASDYGSPKFREKLLAINALREEETGLNNRKRLRAIVQVPLDYYALQGWISPRQYAAGKEFHLLWYYGAEKSGFAQMKYTNQGGGGEREVNAILSDKYQRAKHAINGLVQALICYKVCCFGEWVLQIKPADLNDKTVGKNRRMKLLKDALTNLADFFHLPLDMKDTLAVNEPAKGSNAPAEDSKSLRGHINLNRM